MWELYVLSAFGFEIHTFGFRPLLHPLAVAREFFFF